jgi:hypothetical protein
MKKRKAFDEWSRSGTLFASCDPWVIWQAACDWQKKRDVGVCRELKEASMVAMMANGYGDAAADMAQAYSYAEKEIQAQE